ncbi:efflux RND transporter permease subunit [Rhodanobacter sp. 7MK24]|uniref:efflux RND transporter permease subunit n=1 Tax=Rhodanobacter sp. 7MK24 TaxID=2775922 RepID=UPI00177FD95D|nr:efflux RND transporter permease subunit [Rhodanobacter sp. 7MK24]
MNIFAPMIRRPVGTSLLAIGLAIAGLWAYLLLGVAALPSIEFPFVGVIATDSGASAQTMANTVTAPLERHLGRIPGIKQMSSDSSEGGSQIQIQFDMSRNSDEAARDVQQAINAAMPDLPTGISPPQYFKADTSQIPILLIAVTSASMSADKLYDLTDTLLQPAVAQVPGVAQVQVGGSPHAVRVALHSNAMAHVGITANDISNALTAANVTAPQGALSNGTTQFAVSMNDSLHTVDDFAKLIVASHGGVPIHLADVATITGGQQDQYAANWFNRQPAVLLQISKRPEANSVATVEAILARLPELHALMPADVQIRPIFDLTNTTKTALHEVEVALVLSVVMVALVMLVFLRRARPTVIAMFSVPLSLAGAFVLMWTMGFTLNTLSLVALVLCVGFVVDDAIVVIENIVRHMEQGMSPLEAAFTGVREIGFTVISITLSLIAVFGPMVFGNNMFIMLMREFSVTLIATIVISALVSLTLTPALCGHWLAHEHDTPARKPGRMEQWAERFDQSFLRLYERGLDWAMKHRRLMRWQPPILLILTIVLAVLVGMTAGGGFMPKEDIGLLQAQVSADANVSPTQLAKRTQDIIDTVLSEPAVLDATTILGGNNNPGSVGNTSTLFIDLKPHGDGKNDRHDTAQQVADRLAAKFKSLADMEVSVTPVQFLGGGGGGKSSGPQYTFQLSSNNGLPLQQPTQAVARVMRGMKQFRDVTTSYDTIGKQQMLEVNRNAASRLQISMGEVDDALNKSFGQTPVSTIYSDISQYSVVLTSDKADSLSPDALLNTYVRNAQNKMIPLSAIAHIKPITAPLTISHFNQIESSAISYNLAKGVTQIDGMKLVDQAIYAANLPDGVQKKYTGDNQNLLEALSDVLFLLVAVIAAMYVVLGILYESLIHPLTILSTLPAAGMGAFLAMLLTHTQLTVMSVIAVLMLIGIVKKNAILMVDFALVAEREHGKTPPEAIREAALVRFRPITMTTLVAMGAALPLAIGFGIGSEMRQPLGIAILGGLFVSQLLTLLSTPAMYLWQHDRRERKARRKALREEIRRQKQVAKQIPALPK